MATDIPIPDGFDELDTEEQVEYVQMLWNRISRERDVPIPQWHRDLLTERVASRDPDRDVSWSDLRKQLTDRG